MLAGTTLGEHLDSREGRPDAGARTFQDTSNAPRPWPPVTTRMIEIGTLAPEWISAYPSAVVDPGPAHAGVAFPRSWSTCHMQQNRLSSHHPSLPPAPLTHHPENGQPWRRQMCAFPGCSDCAAQAGLLRAFGGGENGREGVDRLAGRHPAPDEFDIENPAVRLPPELPNRDMYPTKDLIEPHPNCPVQSRPSGEGRTPEPHIRPRTWDRVGRSAYGGFLD
jgi:hypothetical protein